MPLRRKKSLSAMFASIVSVNRSRSVSCLAATWQMIEVLLRHGSASTDQAPEGHHGGCAGGGAEHR
jgi:hypothetical protein